MLALCGRDGVRRDRGVFGNVEDIVVAPTSAILHYAPGTEPARVCRDLGVRQTLQGYVQKLGTQWRVSIQISVAFVVVSGFSRTKDRRASRRWSG